LEAAWYKQDMTTATSESAHKFH